MVENDQVWKDMASVYETSAKAFPERLLDALEKGQATGGDIRGKQSACILVVAGKPTGKSWIDRKVDLRVEDNQIPLLELRRLITIHKAYRQMNFGFAAFGKKDLDASDRYFREAQALYPENKELSYWYAVELVNLGHLERAVPFFKDIFDYDPRWKTEILDRVAEAGVLRTTKENIARIKSL